MVAVLMLLVGSIQAGCTEYAYKFTWIGDGNDKASAETTPLSDKPSVSGYLNDR